MCSAERLRLLSKIISRRKGKSIHFSLYFYTFFFFLKSRLQFKSSFFIVTKIIMFHIITHRLGYGDEKLKGTHSV